MLFADTAQQLGVRSGAVCWQVVKLWSTSGEQRGVVRTQTSLLNSHRIGPVSCLSFHPHRPVLASGSSDSIVTVYPIEHAQSERC